MEQGQIIVMLIVVFYFVPAIISILRKCQNSNTICLLTLLLGWTGIVWIIALIMSMVCQTIQKNITTSTQFEPDNNICHDIETEVLNELTEEDIKIMRERLKILEERELKKLNL